MSDNIQVTAGSGTTLATADVGGGIHHQRVQQGGANATVSQVASSSSNVTLQASNALRRGLCVHNNSTQVLYIKFGTTASTTSYTVKVAADGYYEMPANLYTGRVDAVWAAANGYAYVTEVYV